MHKNELLSKLHNLFANLNANEFDIVSPKHVFNAIFNEKLHVYNNALKFNAENGDKPIQFLQWLLYIFPETECIKDMIISTFEAKYSTTDTQCYFYVSLSKELTWNVYTCII